MKGLEIERKWVVQIQKYDQLRKHPDYRGPTIINQMYLDPKKEVSEELSLIKEAVFQRSGGSWRLRISIHPDGTASASHVLNYKKMLEPGVWAEEEWRVSHELSEILQIFQDGHRIITKIRHLIGDWELDQFLDPLGVWVLEREFPSKEAAGAPLDPPDFIKSWEERTGDEHWSNRAMSRRDWKP